MNQATDNPSTDASLGTLRELLSFRRSELQSAVQAADLARQQQREQAAPDVMDQKDLGEVEVEAHLVQAHEDRDRFELRQGRPGLAAHVRRPLRQLRRLRRTHRHAAAAGATCRPALHALRNRA